MKWLLLFSCFIPFWIHSNAQNCELEGVISSEWNFAHTNDPIDDDDFSAVTRFAATNIIGMTVTGGDTNYLEASFDTVNNMLEIRVTPAFAQYEEVTASGTQHIIGINLAFTCTVGSRNLRINQPIIDVNNHEPTFLSAAYSYNLPMPFPENIEVTNFGVEIDAIDIDITNTRVTFSIEPEGDFIISYGGVVDTLNKVHRARVYAARPLRLTQPTLYTLRVTDIGNPQLSSTAQLQITVNEEASLKQSPSFGRAFYIAEYTADATNKVDASLDLELHGSTPSSIIISGDHSELFELSLAGGTLNVRLASGLPEEVLLESTFIALTVEVTVEDAEYTGRTALIVSIPQPETTTTACPTETTITTTACPEPPTTTECAECICTTTEVTPCPETPTTTECVCTTTETTPCPETPTTPECVCTTTEVTPCPETPTTPECVCTTTETTPCPETPTTSECVCTTTEVTPCPETPTTTECDCESTVCPTTSTEMTCPETTTTTAECICPTTPETNCDCPETSTSSTVCPETECPIECPTTPSTAEPPECTSTTNDCPELDCSLCTTLTSTTTTTATPPNTGDLRFDQEVYTFRLSPTHDIDYTFQATSSTQETIVYDLTNTEGPLPTALSFNRDTGRLTNNGFLTSGLYQLLITATGQESEDTATAAVIISVGSAEICEDGSVRTSYAFKLTTVMENTENIVLFKGEREEIADYNFCIEHQYPFQSGIFYINEETGNVENRAIDREAAIFESMDPAQFTLTLQLNYGPVSQNCPIVTMSSFQSVFTAANNSTRAGDSRQCVHMDNEIFNEPQKTVLAVVVLDDNDNDPVFETTAMIAGYPKQSLSSRVSPPQITRVEATDADLGINAALNYFLESNERVTIHSTTGVLYPSDQIYADENDFEVTVFARDQNGAGRTSQPLRIQIRFLDENHISVLTITDVLLEDMDVRLSQIQGNTGIRIRALTASVLPNSEVSRSVRADGATFLRVTGYALNQNDELVETTQLQEVLENVQGLQVQPLPNNNGGDDDDDPTPPVEEESLVGWIAAVSVLSVLLALVIIAAILAYIFIFRKSKSYSHMEEDGSTPTTTPSPTPQFQKNSKLEFTGSKSEIDVSERRSTGYIFGPTGTGDTGETETDDNKETRKSVSFNTNVERIDIDREAENDSEVKTQSKQDALPKLAGDIKKDDAPEIEVHRL